MKSNLAAWAIAAGLMLSAVGVAAQDNTTTTQQQTTTTSTTTSNDNSAEPQSSSTLPDKESAATPSQGAATTPDTSATATQQNTASSDRSSNVRTITGCLQKGDGGNEFQLTGQDGSTWELRSDAVDLASHVGHTVTVTGAVRNAGLHGMKEDAKREAQEHGMDKSATEHGHMTVTDLTMVSKSCS
ncbi:MAG TPA: hypothetical protein VL240_03615 [Candidatus Binatia bacterium]|nr:hypothetical protein [Candidatus Binatia bacterium]